MQTKVNSPYYKELSIDLPLSFDIFNNKYFPYAALDLRNFEINTMPIRHVLVVPSSFLVVILRLIQFILGIFA